MAASLRDPRYRAVVARLVELRKEAGLNQRDVAERLGRTQSYVAKVELCERRLDIIQLIELLRALGADEGEFLVETAAAIPMAKRRRPGSKG
ncbi:MAG: helix-turn-helix transcriptional regulator [Hyphomonadaceae bacterium]|nr:helix-turn-helix transcriptional regulator [Hyphomonadaceae bacterium]